MESKSAGRQTVRVERQNALKLHGHCSRRFWENPTVLNQCNELPKKKKKRRNRKPQLPSHVKPYYWILQMGLQLLCRTPWNLAALAGGMTWFLFALAVLTNHLGFITVYCDCCSRVLPPVPPSSNWKQPLWGSSAAVTCFLEYGKVWSGF